MNEANAVSEETDAAVYAQNISFSYTKESFMHDLDVLIPQGKVTSIIGPNGCGKSTFLKLVVGMLHPQAGEVLIQGNKASQMKNKERARRLALLVQSSRVPSMDVKSLVACGRYPHQRYRTALGKRDIELIEKALQRTGIVSFRHREMRSLSGGERQRAHIAMTLAQDTSIIALDEPTTYLDVHACHEVLRLIQQLNAEEGKTIMMVLHDIDLALRYSHHIIVLSRGSCLFQGAASDPQALVAIEQAFNIEVCPQTSIQGTTYTLFPR